MAQDKEYKFTKTDALNRADWLIAHIAKKTGFKIGDVNKMFFAMVDLSENPKYEYDLSGLCLEETCEKLKTP